jgi:hypothetical protein
MDDMRSPLSILDGGIVALESSHLRLYRIARVADGSFCPPKRATPPSGWIVALLILGVISACHRTQPTHAEQAIRACRIQ